LAACLFPKPLLLEWLNGTCLGEAFPKDAAGGGEFGKTGAGGKGFNVGCGGGIEGAGEGFRESSHNG
jgi:hypothetical protein